MVGLIKKIKKVVIPNIIKLIVSPTIVFCKQQDEINIMGPKTNVNLQADSIFLSINPKLNPIFEDIKISLTTIDVTLETNTATLTPTISQ